MTSAGNGDQTDSFSCDPSRPISVLLADDNEVNCRLLIQMLDLLGYKVKLAGNGQEAVSRWEEGGHDIVLMDGQMPEMDGFEAARCIRDKEKSTGSRHTPIIAMTANSSDHDRQMARDAGMDDFLAKPFRLQELDQMIKRWQAQS